MGIEPIILLIAATTFFVGGVAKGAIGFGLPLIAIPMLTAFGSLPLALSVAVPPAIATNLWQIWKFRSHRNVAFLPAFLAVGMGSLMLGAVLLKNIENAYIEIALGCLVLTYLLRSSTTREELSEERSKLFAPLVGGVAGLVHGTVGLSGLIATPFFQAAGLMRPAFIFSTCMMFILFASLHMPALAMVGLYERSAVMIGLFAVPPAFVGLWVGNTIGDNLKASTFPKLVRALLAIAAILPIWNGLSKLLTHT